MAKFGKSWKKGRNTFRWMYYGSASRQLTMNGEMVKPYQEKKRGKWVDVDLYRRYYG